MKNAEILKNTLIFANIPSESIEKALSKLGTKTKAYKHGEFILHSGSRITSIGIMLCGSAFIVSDDFWGNRNLIAHLSECDVFAEAYAFIPDAVSTVSVIAENDCRVLFIDSLLLTRGDYPFVQTILMNMLRAVAEKNRLLNDKLTHMSKRTTRAKLMSYLSAQSEKCGGHSFTITLNRQQLADYLGVERSAMSAELGKMQKLGLIEYKKNRFTLQSGSDFMP